VASIFDTALSTLLASQLGVDVVYTPAGGSPLAIRAAFAEPDVQIPIGQARAKDRKRVLVVRAADVAEPKTGDTAEVPAGSGNVLRVIDADVRDPMRLSWSVTLAP